jgi:hypothetical protein
MGAACLHPAHVQKTMPVLTDLGASRVLTALGNDSTHLAFVHCYNDLIYVVLYT